MTVPSEDDANSDELLTTGQTAELLGTTGRHVVNLCQRGELPYSMVGTHRRIRRADAVALRGRAAGNAGGPMTRDQLRALWLHRAVAGKIAANPGTIVAEAARTTRKLLDREPDGAPWLRQWLAILDRDPEVVMRTLVSTDPLARELRANSPFVDVLTQRERAAILDAFARSGASVRER